MCVLQCRSRRCVCAVVSAGLTQPPMTWQPKIGDAVLAVSKGTGGLDTFTKHFYPVRVIKVHVGGSERYPRYMVDLHYSNDATFERERMGGDRITRND